MAGAAVNTTLEPAQSVVEPEAVIEAVGAESAVMLTGAALAVQPAAVPTVRPMLPGVETTILCVVAPFVQR